MSNSGPNAPGAPPSSAEHRSAVAEANRERIATLEQLIRSASGDARLDLPNIQDWCPGVMAHSIFLPAGAVVAGTATATAHFFVLLKGSCTVIDASGGRLSIQAPYLGVTVPGVKRSLVAHEECLWMDIHATELTNADEIAKQFVGWSTE